MTETRPDVSIYLIADNAAAALDFYISALGAEEISRWIDPENGKIGHSEFRIGGQTFYLADSYGSMEKIGVKNPAALGGTSVTIWLRVDNLEEALDRALKGGARLLVPIETMTVDEGCRCRIADPTGYVWTLVAK